MTVDRGLGRRRFLSIAAAGAGLGLLPPHAFAATARVQTWHGTALGAQASIRLHHPDEATGYALIEGALAEIERLETVFSLYRAESAISRLNRDGALDAPPLDLVVLLSQARRYSEITGGAFDVTVQSLWQLYARHFAHPNASPEGPAAQEISAALSKVDYRSVNLDPARVSFDSPGMAITLNGIAQGYVTDRIADMLRRAGLQNVLIDLGEVRALGNHPDGRPWKVGLENSKPKGQIVRRLEISDAAVATSAGAGTPFDSLGRHHHLFDPRSGASSNRYRSLSVKAPTATQADALSTGLFQLAERQAAAIAARVPDVEAIFTLPDGTVHNWGV